MRTCSKRLLTRSHDSSRIINSYLCHRRVQYEDNTKYDFFLCLHTSCFTIYLPGTFKYRYRTILFHRESVSPGIQLAVNAFKHIVFCYTHIQPTFTVDYMRRFTKYLCTNIPDISGFLGRDISLDSNRYCTLRNFSM